MSKRAQRRPRGQRKEYEKRMAKQSAKVWHKLTKIYKPESEWPRVIIPLVRKVMPTMIANQIVGVQPMSVPISDIVKGIEPAPEEIDLDIEKKTLPKQGKEKRTVKARSEDDVAKII